MFFLVGVLAAPAHQADWLYSSELGDPFQAWCANGTALAGGAAAKYRELHLRAGSGLAETQGALDMVAQELAALDAAGRPQSMDPTAGVEAAMAAMELAFTPEAAELATQRIQLRTLLSAYQADYSDGEVLARNSELLLGQLTKAGRQEKNLESEVEFVLKTPALLARRVVGKVVASNATNATVRRATAVALPVRAQSSGIVTVGYPNTGGDALHTKWDDKCLDYNYNGEGHMHGNVYMHGCHGEPNQKWFLMDRAGNTDKGEGEMRTAYDSNCLDYNYDNGNVYMHSCHGGLNQQWYFDDNNDLRTRYNDKCLDYNQNSNNVNVVNCHGNGNQKWYFANMRKVDVTSPLQVLRSLLGKLDQRKAECAAHIAQQEDLKKHEAASSQHLVDATASALQRMQDTNAVLQEYRVFADALRASQAEGDRFFKQERILYATEVEHLTGQAADPLAAAASTAMKACDTAHGLWMEWRDGTDAAFGGTLQYLETRHAQLENQLATQEYLRPDRSPHLMYAKTGPPVGLHCPDEAEYADRRRKIEAAISELTAAIR